MKNEETKRLIRAYIEKAVSFEFFRSERHKESVRPIIQMEKELLLLEIEQFMRDQYN